jgi:hypothetical protein
MLISFDEKKIIKDIVKENVPIKNVYLQDIVEAVYEDVENWLENYGLYSEMVDEIVEILEEDMGVEVKKLKFNGG